MTAGGVRFNPSSSILNLLPSCYCLLILLGGQQLGNWGFNSPWIFFYLLPLLLGGLEMQDYLRTALLFGGLGAAPTGLKTCLLFQVLLHLGGHAMNHSFFYTLSLFLRERDLLSGDLHSFLIGHTRSNSSFAYLCLPSFVLLLLFCLTSTVHTSNLFLQLPFAPQPSSIEMTHRDKDSVKFELSQL